MNMANEKANTDWTASDIFDGWKRSHNFCTTGDERIPWPAEKVTTQQREACIRDFESLGLRCWTVLVTGDAEDISAWACDLARSVSIDVIDCRGLTYRIRLLFPSYADEDTPLNHAAILAEKYCVTLQLLCCYESIKSTERTVERDGASVQVRDVFEDYPVIHQDSAGYLWPPPQTSSRAHEGAGT